MIFPTLQLESVLQVDDKTRLDGTKTYITPDEEAITLIEIEPEASVGFIDVTNKKYLDWQYATDGDKAVTIRVTTDGTPESSSKTITVVTEVDDKLFSADSELTPHEPDILNYVESGRNTYKKEHRRAQEIIIAYLDEHKVHGPTGERLDKSAIIDIEEVNEWSKYIVLRLVFEGRSNAINDIFMDKAMKYRTLEEAARQRGVLRLDRTGDGIAETKADFRSSRLIRR